MEEKDFKRAKIDSLTLGERLERLRENKQLSLQKLALKLRIKQSYLQALEKSDYQSLPSKVYVRGFIGTYARYFGVSKKKLINLFEREYRIYGNIHNKNNPEVETINRLPSLPRIIFTSRTIIISSIVILFISAFLYLFFGFQKFIEAPWLIIQEPISGLTVEDREVEIKGNTRGDAKIFINEQNVQVDLDGNFSDQVGLLPGLNKIIVKSVNKFDKETEEIILVHAQYGEITPADYEEKKQLEELSVKIKIEENVDDLVFVKVVADDILVYEDILEDEKEFFAKEDIIISADKGSIVLISFNNEEFVNLSDEVGMVKDLTFSKEIIDEDNNERQDNEYNVEDNSDDLL